MQSQRPLDKDKLHLAKMYHVGSLVQGPRSYYESGGGGRERRGADQ